MTMSTFRLGWKIFVRVLLGLMLAFTLTGSSDCSTSQKDADGDGFSPVMGDCDDGDWFTKPGAGELCDGKDNNCDGVTEEYYVMYRDGDLDSHGDMNHPAYYCEDENLSQHPESDPPYSSYHYVNLNGLGIEWFDCDDRDPHVNPHAKEVCDGKDQNCNGVPDDGGFMGSDFYCPADSCLSILNDQPQAPSGDYWIQIAGASSPLLFTCDQETDGGGWTELLYDNSDPIDARWLHYATEEIPLYGKAQAFESYSGPTTRMNSITLISVSATEVRFQADILVGGDSDLCQDDQVGFILSANGVGTAAGYQKECELPEYVGTYNHEPTNGVVVYRLSVQRTLAVPLASGDHLNYLVECSTNGATAQGHACTTSNHWVMVR